MSEGTLDEKLSLEASESGPDVPKGIAPSAAPIAILQGVAEDEDRIIRRPVQWLALMLAAAFVGVATGAVGGVFRLALEHADIDRINFISWVHVHIPAYLGWLVPTVVCGLGAGMGLWMTERLSPHTAGSGIPRVQAVLRNHLYPASSIILPVKFIGGLLSIGSGLALGREGPIVQMGGTIGRITDQRLRWFTPEPWTLIAAGAGVGLAVAFNAPLAAVIFVVEELIHRFSARIFSATLVACISGVIVLRWILGNQTDFIVPSFGTTPSDVLPAYIVLGLFAGVFGVVYNVCLIRALDLFRKLNHLPKGTKGAIVGVVVGLIAWFDPKFVGGGENMAQQAITSGKTMHLIALVLIGRFVLTLFSYGSGSPGGLFAPLLALGALVGAAFSQCTTLLHINTLNASACTVVAMAACFTAVVRSPLTGIVLILEMTGSWTLILPMMAASVAAYTVPELLGNHPIYDTLRARDEKIEKAMGRHT